MNETPETDALMDVWRVGKLLSVSAMLNHARKLERERDEWREESEKMIAFAHGATRDAGQAMKERDSARAEVARLREALQRLADCDWVITPHDRMDAVREIAREALAKMEAAK